ncbi:MAG: XRE family transcriptional regulator [Pseudonocardiaceae bacterium]
MAEPNDLLRRAREGVESPNASGDCLSRQELAELVNAWVFEHTQDHRMVELDANYVGKLEQGSIRWPQDPVRRAGFRAVLGVATDAELGFRRPRRSRIMVRGVDRQHFIRAGLGVGAAAVTGPAALLELLTPTQPARIPSVVGMTHVAEVRAATDAFAGWDARYGGGLMREAAVAQLRYFAELLNARCPEGVRRELLTAVGSFAETAGFMAVDDFVHDDARRILRFAQSCAEEALDWHLRAKVLKSLASQAICCGDPDTAVTFTESALVRADRLTATEQAMLHTVRAHALGMLGRAEDAATAVTTADKEFSRACPAEDPIWMPSYDVAHHQGETGRALWHAARRGQFVDEARDRLQYAVAEYVGSAVRARTRSQIKLASLVMATGDPLEAVALGSQALDAAGPLRSRRTTHDLHDLRYLAEPHASLVEVANLRDRLRTVLAA